MKRFSPSFLEVIPPSQDPQIFSNNVWVLNVSNNLANKSCNTRGLARVVTSKCNEKGGPFFKFGVKSRDFTHFIPCEQIRLS